MVGKKLYVIRIKAEYYIKANSKEIARQDALKIIAKELDKLEVSEVVPINMYPEDQEEEIKTIIKEDHVHRKDAVETEVIKVKLLGKTDKAYQAIFNDTEGWIPKSTIHNRFEYKQDQEATLIVETWVLKKNFKWGE